MSLTNQIPLPLSKEPPLDLIVEAVLAGSGRTIETAETLPPVAYTSQAFFDLEVEKIFRQDWVCVGHVSQVPNVGDYFTVDFCEDMFVVVRGKDRIRVLSRVCLHRWAPVVPSGAGKADLFICPFHNWTYELDGQLRAVPFMQKADGLNISACRLPEIRTEIIKELGLIFITLSDTVESISSRIADLIERLKPYHLKDAVGIWQTSQDVPFNWKIFIETGQECYHHFAAHKETLEPTRPTRLSWCEAGTPTWTVCHSALKPEVPQSAAGIGLPNFPGLSEEALRSISYYHVFPLTRIFLRPDRVVLRLVYPVGPKQTHSTSISLVTPEVAAQKALVEEKIAQEAKRNAIQSKEDMAIDMMQQMGAASSTARPGRLSHLEATVWHLAEYVRARIAS